MNSELLEFARTRPVWQQDLIRRICTQPDVSSNDIDQVLQSIKSVEGLAEAQETTPVAESHLSQRAAGQHLTARLAAISDVRNANQLAPSQHLPFALKGITLIYGGNGSGKTGYARIVKQLCRARRDKQEPLLGNVYKVPSGSARAKITYFIGDQQHVFDWEDGTSTPPELSRISVFDAACAPLYADRQNEIEFLPLGLDVLPRLGRVCEILAQKLQQEIIALSKSISVPLPAQTPGTNADKLARRLTLETPQINLPAEEEIQQGADWSNEHQQRLLEIEEELRKLSEPAKVAAQYRRLKITVDAFEQRLAVVDKLVGTEAVTEYRTQFNKTKAARLAASIVAEGQFGRDPLGKAVGNTAWRRLYEYAEQFSAEVYPGESFPATGKDRVCLLCQQPYDESAADRMRRFRLFIEDTSQKEAEKEDDLLKGQIRKISDLNIPKSQELDLQFMELSEREPSFEPIKTGLSLFIQAAAKQKEAVVAALNGESSFDAASTLSSGALSAARDFAVVLDDTAKKFDEAAVSGAATEKLKSEHTELLARQKLNGSIATVLSRRIDIATFHKLQQCKDQCDTTQISRRNSEFREKYLTPEFADQIRKEIEFLGLGYLPVKIDAKTEKGTSYIGVTLSKIVNARTSNILSEGEFRALALACFFAEIANIPNHDGVVVDDPVSSLDHRHIRQVALRLIEEAKARPQLIVFTHDLSFYYGLWISAAEAQIPIYRNWLHNSALGFGVVAADDGPWVVKKTKERMNVLEIMLAGMPLQDSVPPSVLGKYVNEFYARLRETWERLIEEKLLNGVVGRFQPGVATQSLKGVNVTDEDYQKVFFAMRKASEFSGHDWALGREGDLPTISMMRGELAAIREYDKELTKRAEQLEKQRRELEQPPKGEVVQAPLK
jgi:energy-coupling factor transporter ATP-binding protein EcfA2